MGKALLTIGLLVLSNVFMTLAWYGHLKFKSFKFTQDWGLVAIILVSWGIALFEYTLQVPANRIGFKGNDGPFNLMQLKVLQEVISISVFVALALLAFKTETLRWNHLAAFVCLVLAVWFVFMKQ
jgi:uncharacterized protein